MSRYGPQVKYLKEWITLGYTDMDQVWPQQKYPEYKNTARYFVSVLGHRNRGPVVAMEPSLQKLEFSGA